MVNDPEILVYLTMRWDQPFITIWSETEDEKFYAMQNLKFCRVYQKYFCIDVDWEDESAQMTAKMGPPFKSENQMLQIMVEAVLDISLFNRDHQYDDEDN